MALSGAFPINLPGISNVMDKLDKLKGDFLAVPANTRAALDKLARIRMTINKTGSVPIALNEAAQQIEGTLKRVQMEWNTSAERFTMLDDLRRNQKAISLDGLTIAGQLATSAVYVIKNSANACKAVDTLAANFLTPEQQKQLGVETTGVAPSTVGAVAAGVSIPVVLGVLAFFMLRKR